MPSLAAALEQVVDPRPAGLAPQRQLPDAEPARRAAAAHASSATTRMALSPAHDALESRLQPLWLAAQAGDEAAYREALRCIAQRLRSHLRRRMQTLPDDLEDLVQETLLALHLQRGSWDPALPVSAWALAIARHKLVDLWRRRGRQDALHDPLDGVDEVLLVQPESEPMARRDLGALLAGLPTAQREAIMLTKIDGLSVAEASVRTGASESAIKVQVHRGLKKLAALVRCG